MLLLQPECNSGIIVIQQICRVVAGLFLPAVPGLCIEYFSRHLVVHHCFVLSGEKDELFFFSKELESTCLWVIRHYFIYIIFLVKADQGILLWGTYQFKFALAEGEICRDLAYQPGNHFVWEEWFTHWCSQQTEAVVDAVCGPWAPGIGWYGPGPLDQMFYRICKDMKAFLKDWEVAWEDQGEKEAIEELLYPAVLSCTCLWARIWCRNSNRNSNKLESRQWINYTNGVALVVQPFLVLFWTLLLCCSSAG